MESPVALVEALLAPKNVAIVGANDRPGSWSQRTWENLRRYGFPGAVYPVNPRRSEIWGVPCSASLDELPEPPDHVAILVPPQAVAGVLREAARAGARSATIFTAGIGDANDPRGAPLGREVARAIAETGLAVCGPNCMGNLCARTRTVTLNDSRPLELARGPVAMVGQSGGVMLFTAHALQDRCIDTGYIVTSGNELGLTTADYVASFAADPDVRVVVSYLEGIRDASAFRSACAAAQRARKHVVVLKLGRSPAGRAAALAHTGALAGDVDAFDAVLGELGVIRVETPDDVVETVEALLYCSDLRGSRLAALTLSGAFRGLLLDLADRRGVTFTTAVDGGFDILQSQETYLHSIAALDADPNVDLVLVQEELPREELPARPVRYMTAADELAATRATKPLAYVSLVSYGQTEFSRELRRKLPHLAIFQEAGRALDAIAKLARCAEMERLAASRDETVAHPEAAAIEERLRRRAASAAVALDEAASKELLRAYGIALLQEEVVACDLVAVERAAAAIGDPVVLKAVGPNLLHKSDAGAIALDVRGAGERRDAFERIVRSVKSAGVGPIDGILVAPYVTGGIEAVAGLHRDPEVGIVAMVGTGGVLLELVRDVAFAAPPITRAKAADMIERTRLARLLDGYRGAGPFDRRALVGTLVALGWLATDLGDVIESVDINPFFVRQKSMGGAALDALVVLAPRRDGANGN